MTRRSAILAAAETLWSVTPYADLSMAEVARQAGVAKGTLYLYFSTKEDLFLALLQERLFAWMNATRAALLAEPPRTPEALSALLTASLRGETLTRRLLAMLGSVLEQHASLEAALAFKRALAVEVDQLAAALPLPRPTAQRFVLHLNALVVGWQQATEDTPARRAALTDPALVHLAPDFETELNDALTALLRGLTREEQP